jgi:hypothetical protein
MTDAPRRKRDQSKATFLASTPKAVNAPASPKEASAGAGRPRQTPLISIATYNQMYAAWCERQTVQHVMDTCGVNRTTAERYVEKGDVTRKLPAIRARWENAVQRAQAAEDYTLVKERREVQTVARAFLQRVAARIAKLDPSELDANKVIVQLQVTQTVLERTLGVADTTVSVQHDDRFRGWSNEELMEFARTGTTPPHARTRDTSAGAARRAQDD